jgi:hypothetical protein
VLYIINKCYNIINIIYYDKLLKDNRLPIIQSADRPPPAHVMVDEEGRLIDDVWRRGIEPPAEWRHQNVGSCLRENYVEEIRERGLYHDRNFNR